MGHSNIHRRILNQKKSNLIHIYFDNEVANYKEFILKIYGIYDHQDLFKARNLTWDYITIGDSTEMFRFCNHRESLENGTFFLILMHVFIFFNFLDVSKERRLTYCKDLVIKKLPDQNYVVLKFLIEFLSLVVDR